MVETVVFLQAATAAVLAAFAVAVALAARGPERGPAAAPARGYLVAALAVAALDVGAFAASQVANAFWAPRLLRFSVVGSVAVPALLHAFATTFPTAQPRRAGLVASWLAASVIAVAYAWWPRAPGDAAEIALRTLVFAYAAVVHFGVYGVTLRRFIAQPTAPGSRFVQAAFALLAFPVLHRAGGWGALLVEPALGLSGSPVPDVAFVYGPVAAAFGFAWFAARRLPRPARAWAVTPAIVGTVLSVVAHVHAQWTRGEFVGAVPDPITAVTEAAVAVKWLAFAAFMATAVLRYDAFPTSVAARRRAARVLIAACLAVAFLVVGSTTRAVWPNLTASVSVTEFALLTAVLVATQGFRRAVDRVAEGAFGVPRTGDAEAVAAAYRSAVQQVLATGGDVATDTSLARLRNDLGLTEPVATALAETAEASFAGPLVPGQVVARRYRVERYLGRGGSARAFLARDLNADCDVVLKELEAGDEAAAVREANAAAAVQHPNVLGVTAVVRRSGAIVLVTPFAPGGSLQDRVALEGPLTPAAATRVGLDVLAGLAAVHDAGVLHRDIAPGNVLFAADGRALVADFGVARTGAQSTVAVGGVAGTPGHVAPERLRGEAATVASDVYSVGAVLRAATAPPLPDAFAAVVAQATAERPSARFASAAAMHDALARTLKT